MYKIQKAAVGGVLVVSLSAATLTGCSNSIIKSHDYTYSDKKVYDDYYGVVINDINEHGNNLVRSNCFENFYILKSANAPYLKQYFYINKLQSYDKKVSLEEFRKTTGIENPTPEMIIGSIDQNTHLTSEEKELIKNEAIRIHKNNPKFDDTIFMYNTSDLDIKYIESPSDFKCIFNPFADRIIVNIRTLPTKEEQEEAIKQVIGYMFTTAMNVTDDGTILYCSDSDYALHIDYMYYSDKVIELGGTFKNGFAANISNEVIDGNVNPELAEDAGILNVYLGMCGLTLADYEKIGYEGFLEVLRDCGLNELFFHIVGLDDPDEQRNKCAIVCDSIKTYVRCLKSNGFSNEEINDKVKPMLEDAFKDIIRPEDAIPFQTTGKMELLIELEYLLRPQKEQTR